MQDFQSIPGFAGRIFSSSAGGSSSSDSAARRLRGYPSSQPHHLQPPVKCPRCDSSNTKFCYYNNYNLSQPRHFCKSCRRYWTKGGVLRNVPVGGGCRKNSKRSSSSKSASKSEHHRRRPSSASGSSSDSAASAPNPNLNPEPSQNLDPDPVLEPAAPEVFAEPTGSFTNLVAGGMLGFEFLDPAAGFRVADPDPDPDRQQKMDGIGIGDQAVGMDLAAAFQGRMDWPPPPPPTEAVVDSSGLFDLTSSIDPAVYWNQGHWGDTDPSLYLPNPFR